MIFESLRTTWSWYSNAVIHIKSPAEGFAEKIRVQLNEWHSRLGNLSTGHDEEGFNEI